MGSGGTRDKRGFLCARGGQIVEGALSAQGYARLAALRDADPAYTVRYTLQDHTFSDLASVAKFLVAKDQETQRAAREKAYASAQPCAYAQYVAPATPCDAEPLFFRRSCVSPCARCRSDLFGEQCPCCRAQMGCADACAHCNKLLGRSA